MFELMSFVNIFNDLVVSQLLTPQMCEKTEDKQNILIMSNGLKTIELFCF